MKRILSILLIVLVVLSLYACSKQELVNMTTELNGEYAAIVWENRTYVPYGALSAYGDRGQQIGIVDGDENHKVYECKGYSSDEWIVTALLHDAAMLYRGTDVTEIPNGWQSEYDWNS